MTEPAPDEAAPRAVPLDPTLRVDPPPTPGRAARAEVEAGTRSTPPFRPDQPTVTIAGSQPKARNRTLEFGAPAPVKVTVGPRIKPRRRRRTWPWIVAVVLALIVLGVALLVMQLQGVRLDSNASGLPSGGSRAAAIAAAVADRAEHQE